MSPHTHGAGITAYTSALPDILSRCTSLVSLSLAQSLLSSDFFTTLGRFHCAKTLRSLTLDEDSDIPNFSVDQILAALPSLETLDAGRFVHLADMPSMLRHGVHALSLSCPGPVLPTRAVWTSGLPALRRLCLDGLPAVGSLRRRLLDDIGTCLGISEAFGAFVEQNLPGLEKLGLKIASFRGNTYSMVMRLVGLPELRNVSLSCTYREPPQREPLRLCASPKLVYLHLWIPCPVEIAMPALRSLELISSHHGAGSTLDCPSLQELFLDCQVDAISTAATAARLRVLHVCGKGSLRVAVGSSATFPALESLTYPVIPPPELLAGAPRLVHLSISTHLTVWISSKGVPLLAKALRELILSIDCPSDTPEQLTRPQACMALPASVSLGENVIATCQNARLPVCDIDCSCRHVQLASCFLFCTPCPLPASTALPSVNPGSPYGACTWNGPNVALPPYSSLSLSLPSDGLPYDLSGSFPNNGVRLSRVWPRPGPVGRLVWTTARAVTQSPRMRPRMRGLVLLSDDVACVRCLSATFTAPSIAIFFLLVLPNPSLPISAAYPTASRSPPLTSRQSFPGCALQAMDCGS